MSCDDAVEKFTTKLPSTFDRNREGIGRRRNRLKSPRGSQTTARRPAWNSSCVRSRASSGAALALKSSAGTRSTTPPGLPSAKNAGRGRNRAFERGEGQRPQGIADVAGEQRRRPHDVDVERAELGEPVRVQPVERRLAPPLSS